MLTLRYAPVSRASNVSIVNVPASYGAVNFSNATVPLPGARDEEVDVADDGSVVDAAGTVLVVVSAAIVDVLVVTTGASVDGNTVLLPVKCATEHFCKLTINRAAASKCINHYQESFCINLLKIQSFLEHSDPQ